MPSTSKMKSRSCVANTSRSDLSAVAAWRSVSVAQRLPDHLQRGSFCWLRSFCVRVLSGILSRPPSILSSFPPDVDVPLPLREDVDPVVGGGLALGFDVLAAGSPVMDPRPLGLP